MIHGSRVFRVSIPGILLTPPPPSLNREYRPYLSDPPPWAERLEHTATFQPGGDHPSPPSENHRPSPGDGGREVVTTTESERLWPSGRLRSVDGWPLGERSLTDAGGLTFTLTRRPTRLGQGNLLSGGGYGRLVNALTGRAGFCCGSSSGKFSGGKWMVLGTSSSRGAPTQGRAGGPLLVPADNYFHPLWGVGP